MRTPVTLLGLVVSVAACTRSPQADLVVYGRVWTGDSATPWGEAVAVRADTVVAVGTREAVEALAGRRTRVIDNDSGLVVPGFGDSHTHFISGGFQLMSVDLRDADTPAEFIRRLKEFAATEPPGRWILGGDWDHERWTGTPLPRRDWIDSVTPNHPVFVSRLDGHMGVANSAALRLAGITSGTRDVPGGEIVRYPGSGEPTGLLKDNAMNAVYAAIPAASAEDMDSAVARAMRHAASLGVTSVHFVSADWNDFAALRRARASGRMITRVNMYMNLSLWRELADTVRALGPGDEWLRWDGIKQAVDGSLGSTTAAFYEPYLDAPRTRGLLLVDSAQVREAILGADSAGLQLAIHAIGDRANSMVLGIMEEAARRNGARDRRPRIEHAQHLRQQDIPRFGGLGVIPSMQPYHIIDDGRWAWKRLDARRIAGTYAMRSLLSGGARPAFGSDWTVAPLDPIWGVYAAVTRRTLDDRNPSGWVPEQKVSLEETLRAYTAGVAYAGFADRRVGMLRAGMAADLVLLDRDLFRMPPESLNQARVKATVVGGRVVYERPAQ